MKKLTVFVCLFVAFFGMSGAVFAQRVDVRLASPMPRNSTWGNTLEQLAAEWARVTNNEVRLRILHNGVEGTEARMMSSLATNNIQAALLTSFGIAEFCPPIMTLSIPFFIRNDREFDMVLREVQPLLDAQVNRSNYVVVAWSKSGWVNIFSKDPVLVPDDLRRHRLASSPEAASMNTVFRAMRFNLVEADTIELGQRLASGSINAVYSMPAAVAPLGLHRSLNHMLDIPIAPFLGGIVMNRATWNRIKPEHQREISRVTQRIAAEFDAALPRASTDAIAMMRRDGLRVNQPNSAQEAQWRALLDTAMPSLLGTAFDRDMYQRINVILARARGSR